MGAEDKVFSDLPKVISETLKLLEEKRKECIVSIDNGFESYYKKYYRTFYRIIRKLVVIKHTKYQFEYKFDKKEFAKLFFIYWLFTEYSNPDHKSVGINILNVLVKIDSILKYSIADMKRFNNWLLDQVQRQNIKYTFGGDYAYLQEIAEFTNRHYQILKRMDYTKYDAEIIEISQDFKLVKSNLDKLEKKKTLDMAIETVRKDPQQYRILFPFYKEIAYRENYYKKNGSIRFIKIEIFIKKLCLTKVNRKAITQAFYRFRIKNNLIQ